MVKFGITERGDIAFTDEYIDKILNNTVEAAVLISKGMPTSVGKHFMIEYANQLIFHATTTGLGGTIYEPNVAPYKQRLNEVIKFVNEGFPITHVVIRVDPIMNTVAGFGTAKSVIDYAYQLGFRRFRYSFMDMYRHVIARFKEANLVVPPNIGKVPKDLITDLVDVFMKEYENKGCKFEACGEYTRHKIGCISVKDFKLCGIDESRLTEPTWKQRACCGCCVNKIELITSFGRKRCPHKCIYCYWKDD